MFCSLLTPTLFPKQSACLPLPEVRLPTSIGVFASRDQAERAVHELLDAQVPKHQIFLLTPDDDDHQPRTAGKTVGAYVGGAIGTSTGLSLGLATATLVVPGIGPVLAIGLGAAALLGFGGMTAGASVGSGLDELNDSERAAELQSSSAKNSTLPDAAFFRNVLRQNRSVVVVEAADDAIHYGASAVLNRLSIGAEPGDDAPSGKITTRHVGDVFIISLSGRIVAGDPTAAFREIVSQAIDLGSRKLLVDMSAVTFIDSSGIGELVHTSLRIRKAGGQLKLTRLSAKVAELMRITHLDKVMDIEEDETQALAAFG